MAYSNHQLRHRPNHVVLLRPAAKQFKWLRYSGLILCALLLGAPFVGSLAHAHELQSFELLVPDAGAKNVQAAIKSSEWQQHDGMPSLGFYDQPLWIRFQVPANKDVMLLSSTWLERFDVYLVAGNRTLKYYRSGTSVPMSRRPIHHPQFAFPIPASPGSQAVTVYIRHHLLVQTARYPIEFFSDTEFDMNNIRMHLSHGMFYGMFLIMLLYNLAVYWAVRDRTYLYFVLYNLGAVGFLSGSDGFSRFFLWPDIPQLELLTPIWLALGMVALVQFAIKFFEVNVSQKLWYTALRGIQVGTILSSIVSAFTEFPGGAGWLAVLLAIEIGVLTILTLRYARLGNTNAWIFMAANAPVALSAAHNIFSILGWTPASVYSLELTFYSIAFEQMMLSILLASRLRRYRSESQEAKLRSMDLTNQVRQLEASTSMYKEHEALQRSVQHAQKLKSIGQLTGGVAHDFNNILASILGFSELALDKAENGSRSDQIRYLQEIQKAGERGAKLVKQLLIYSRSSSKEARDVDLNEALLETSQLLRGSLPSSVIIETDLPKRPLTCRLDPILLQQSLVNLALNATEAMQERGKISISLATRSVSNVTCTSCLERFDGEYAVIKVEDSGPGLKDNPHDLFNPFFTSKTVGEGSGMGLSVVHGIVHEHHGHVQLSNQAQAGVRAILYLPKNAISESVAAVNQQILLVVEDASVRSLLSELLASQGYRVTVKVLPHQALEAFVVNPHAFDLVLTDHLMTEQTGLELAQEMRRLRPDLPVAMTTGHPKGLSASDLERSGIAAVFEKPIKAHLLLAKVGGLLNS